MEIKKVSPQLNSESLNPSRNVANGIQSGGLPSFGETLKKINDPIGGMPNAGLAKTNSLTKASADPVKFSNHALERMIHRGIKFSPEEIGKLNDAVQRAQSKGSKNSLILMNENALIVSVKNNTVVTVVDKNSLKENVFTNIDSTIVM